MRASQVVLVMNLPASEGVAGMQVQSLDWEDPSFIYLFLPRLGLHCCTQAYSRQASRNVSLVEVLGLLIAVKSLVAQHRL